MSGPFNILDNAPIDAVVQKLVEKLPDPKLAARIGKLYKDALVKNEKNFRLAELGIIKSSEEWVLKAFKSGTLCVFDPDKAALRRFNRITRDLIATCQEIDYMTGAPAPLNDRDAQLLALAKEFIAKLGRASLKAAEEKARFFAISRRRRLDEERAGEDVCEPGEVIFAPGLVWVRVRSAKALFAVGREFENCLRGSARNLNTYATQLMNKSAQFWVLRDHTNRGLIVVMVSTLEKRMIEVRGFRNALIDPDCAELVCLGEVKGWRRPNGAFGPPQPRDGDDNTGGGVGALGLPFSLSHFVIVPPTLGARRRH